MRKIRVAIASVKNELSYQWYKIKSRVQPMELRGKEVRLNQGDVIGFRPGSNGKTTRMVLKDSIGYVMSPTKEQVEYLLKKCEPLIGGAIDTAKIGLVTEPKVSVKDRRILEELKDMSNILKRYKDITDIKIENKRLLFRYDNRPYSIISDPS